MFKFELWVGKTSLGAAVCTGVGDLAFSMTYSASYGSVVSKISDEMVCFSARVCVNVRIQIDLQLGITNFFLLLSVRVCFSEGTSI